MDCSDCVHFYSEPWGWGTCKHDEPPEEDAETECPHYYSKHDAKDDAKLRYAEYG